MLVSALFPPDIIGGAEFSAYNNACYHRDAGHDIAILTTAKNKAEELNGENVDGMRMWRHYMPRLYPAIRYADQPAWKKIVWHLQDHFDPRNRTVIRKAITGFAPDYIYIHVVQGLGWNILGEIAAHKIPVSYFLHDLSLACYRTSMFRGDKECTTLCAACRLSSAYKTKQITAISQLKFISPSRANLERVRKFFPLDRYPSAHILNPNRYPAPTKARESGDVPRILYVGRLDVLKGVDLLLSVAEKLSAKHKFILTLVGGGRDEAKYRARYEGKPWCHFAGFVSQDEVGNYMNNADLLCVPSIWFENSPGVVIRALGLGLPVLGSDKGGIGELVNHDQNGRIVPAGDAEAWEAELSSLLARPDRLIAWGAYAKSNAGQFDAKTNGKKIFDFSIAKAP